MSAARFASCEAVLRAQQDAWNRADLAAFVEGYARSPDTVFASASGVELGSEALLARYERRYPNAAAMGRLSFTGLRFEALGANEVCARGRWLLAREHDRLGGSFVLVFRKTEPGWRIVLDYTSSDAPG